MASSVGGESRISWGAFDGSLLHDQTPSSARRRAADPLVRLRVQRKVWGQVSLSSPHARLLATCIDGTIPLDARIRPSRVNTADLAMCHMRSFNSPSTSQEMVGGAWRASRKKPDFVRQVSQSRADTSRLDAMNTVRSSISASTRGLWSQTPRFSTAAGRKAKHRTAKTASGLRPRSAWTMAAAAQQSGPEGGTHDAAGDYGADTHSAAFNGGDGSGDGGDGCGGGYGFTGGRAHSHASQHRRGHQQTPGRQSFKEPPGACAPGARGAPAAHHAWSGHDASAPELFQGAPRTRAPGDGCRGGGGTAAGGGAHVQFQATY